MSKRMLLFVEFLNLFIATGSIDVVVDDSILLQVDVTLSTHKHHEITCRQTSRKGFLGRDSNQNGRF